MASDWYVARDGERFGPFTSDEMSAGVREGQLRREDFVWRAGMAEWQLAGDVPGLWQPPEPSVFSLPIRGLDDRQIAGLDDRQISGLDDRQDDRQLATTQVAWRRDLHRRRGLSCQEGGR
jgi:hypothetical protein